MKRIDDNFKYFATKHKDIYEAYKNYGQLVHQEGGPLEDKTRALLKVVISSVSDHDYALETHMKKAIDAGCSREEIEHGILLTAPTVGFPNMMESLLVMRGFFDKE